MTKNSGQLQIVPRDCSIHIERASTTQNQTGFYLL